MTSAGRDAPGWTVLPGRWGTLRRRAGRGPSLLLLPGLGCPASHFTEGASIHLPGAWDLWIWEAPGAGRTPFGGSGQETMPELAESLASALDEAAEQGEAGLTRGWTVVGHSMGGLVGLLLCELRPGAVAGFVNVEGNLGPEDCIFTASVVQQSRDAFRSRWLPEKVEALRASREPGSRAYAEVLDAMESPEAYYRHSHSLVEVSQRPGLLERFLDLEAPHLYLHGAWSGDGVTLSRVRRGCPVVAIPDAGHFPHLDRPDAFYARVGAFVEGLDPRGRP